MAVEGRWLTAKNQDKRIQGEQENVEYDGIDVHQGDENRADSARQVQVIKLQCHRRVGIGEMYKNIVSTAANFYNSIFKLKFWLFRTKTISHRFTSATDHDSVSSDCKMLSNSL